MYPMLNTTPLRISACGTCGCESEPHPPHRRPIVWMGTYDGPPIEGPQPPPPLPLPPGPFSTYHGGPIVPIVFTEWTT